MLPCSLSASSTKIRFTTGKSNSLPDRDIAKEAVPSGMASFCVYRRCVFFSFFPSFFGYRVQLSGNAFIGFYPWFISCNLQLR